MSAGILEFDQGIVNGTTWHGLPQYRTINGPVPYEEALKVLDYPVVKEPLCMVNGLHPVRAYCLIRPDKVSTATGRPIIVCDHTGPAYTILNNRDLLTMLNDRLLSVYGDKINIDSCGTLWNGRKAFVNLSFDAWHAPGDESKTISKIMVLNCFEEVRPRACACDNRVVCDNTRRLAEMTGAANGTLRLFYHRTGIADRMTEYVIELADIYAGLAEHRKVIEAMTQKQLDSNEADAVLTMTFPDAPEGTEMARRNVQSRRLAVLGRFEAGDAGLTAPIRRSAYAMFQAVTGWTDHDAPLGPRSDAGFRYYDGLYGRLDGIKQAAWTGLVALTQGKTASQLLEGAVA